jgi:hypothetical protein
LKGQLNKFLVYVFVLAVFAACSSCASSKKPNRFSFVDESLVKELPTYNTWYSLPPKPPKQYFRIIYVENSTEWLIGNPCVTQYTAERGFMLAPYTDFPKRNPSEIKVWYENLPTKWSLFFRYGPFWKSKLRNRVEQCRKSSGDFVG